MPPASNPLLLKYKLPCPTYQLMKPPTPHSLNKAGSCIKNLLHFIHRLSHIGMCISVSPCLLKHILLDIIKKVCNHCFQLIEITLYLLTIVTTTEDGSVLNTLYQGVKQGWYPPLIFLGIGAMTDFSALISQPRLLLIGAAAQMGIFGAYLLALVLGFDPNQAGAIGIIGGADGPTAIFLSSKLAPDSASQ